MADIRVRAFLQRNTGTATVRLWLLPIDRADVAWFHDMDFTHALRAEMAQNKEEGRQWGAFESSFFGPEFQSIEALSRVYDERTLDYEFTRAKAPAPQQMSSE